MILEYMFGVYPLEVIRNGKPFYKISEEHYLRLFSIAPEKCKNYPYPQVMQLLYQLALRCIHPNIDHRPSVDWIVIILREMILIS